jgi:hypothetical protein
MIAAASAMRLLKSLMGRVPLPLTGSKNAASGRPTDNQ